MATMLDSLLSEPSECPYEWALLLFHFTERQTEAKALGHPGVKDRTRTQTHPLNAKIFVLAPDSSTPESVNFIIMIFQVFDFSVKLIKRRSTDARSGEPRGRHHFLS